MRCQHCYASIIEAHPDPWGNDQWVRDGVDPNCHTLSDMNCERGSLRLMHKPMPKIEVAK